MSKRLAKELKEFVEEPKDWCRATAVQDKLFLWHAEILGPVGFLFILVLIEANLIFCTRKNAFSGQYSIRERHF